MLKIAKLLAVLVALGCMARPEAAMAVCTDMSTVKADAGTGAVQATLSSGWVDVAPAGSLTFQTARQSCVLVVFTFQVGSLTQFAMQVQALIDNNPCAPAPAQVPAPSPGSASEHAYQSQRFFCGVGGGGTHTVQMQFAGTTGGAELDGRMLEVWYRQ